MLEYCADTIAERFPDYEQSPFVNEKFHGDWSRDLTWGWQQNRGVVGHNLKIAWNLTRIRALEDKKSYAAFAKKIAELMPKHGMDAQRGGWYDVVNRELAAGQDWHRFAWHDRKAWWQQEQGILAYQIMAGVEGDPEYLRLHRESSAFYNAWFLDHDAGGVYFNVLANGLPFMVGTEREKGSHSMSGYHSFELCFLAAVYTNLLITKQPLTLHFKPGADASRLLRVAPDMLPAGSIRIGEVTLNGKAYDDFDADGLTVSLPQSHEPLAVKVRLDPREGMEHFSLAVDGANMTLKGDLDPRAVPYFTGQLAKMVRNHGDRVTIDVSGLSSMSKPAARALMFHKAKMEASSTMVLKGANQQIRELLTADEFAEAISLE
jgi:ABC-type transporter Mla MlaB component